MICLGELAVECTILVLGLAVLLATDTGKCIDFATRNKNCRFCSVPTQKRAQPNSLRLQEKFFGLLKSNGIVCF